METPTGNVAASPRTGRGPGAGSVDDIEDARLIGRLREGDECAFTTLVSRHQAPMLRVAMAHVSSRASAEDVVQETWMAVVRGVDRFEGRSSLRTWLFRILTNRAKTTGQREGRCVPAADIEARDHTGERSVPVDRFFEPSPCSWSGHWVRPPTPWERDLEDRLVVAEAVRVARDAINGLSPVQRSVIALRDVDCWTAHEVCDALGLSESNQRVLLHRARSKVREKLAAHDAEAGTR